MTLLVATYHFAWTDGENRAFGGVRRWEGWCCGAVRHALVRKTNSSG